ncbi:MAG: peptide deformylase [Clostridia bacterium]|nr:peptide deformylase [Clostridia bacterium]MDD4275803.1 peptide deformylase [Clostridia bacterium]
MATRKILLSNDPILRIVCRPATIFDDGLKQLIDDMKDTMQHNDGAGLAAPQVGINKRVAIVEADGQYLELVNPEILKTSGNINGVEGCLSFPGKYGYVDRPKKVVVRAQDRNGIFYELTAYEMLARAICHEIDHLNGILFVDKMTKEAKE